MPAQVWNDVSQFQSAYQLGAGEAAAAFNLLTEVDPKVVNMLEGTVQPLDTELLIVNQTLPCVAHKIHAQNRINS